MTIGPGSRIGPYEVTALIGEGGMGKVWRAHHAALKRDVALKVLPDLLAGDAERLARFGREAQVLASLNHPNIAHLYGLEEVEGVKALVMELVEGPTLADLITQASGSGLQALGVTSPPSAPGGERGATARGGGPPSPELRRGLSTDDALHIARQIADALATAHEQGVIHRDLKPANVKIRPDGVVKVLDFGLATYWTGGTAGTSGRWDRSNSPTITSPAMTQAGMILGTAAYMSPEQARGKPVDTRADIWAFGAVLFEMLAGQRAFAGEDVTVTLARVVEREPNFDAIPPSVPAHVRHAVQLCLRKDPNRRVSDIRDVRLVLEGELATTPAIAGQPGPPPAQAAPRWRQPLLLALAAAAGAGLVTAAVTLTRPPVEPMPVVRLVHQLPEGRSFRSLGRRIVAIAPDGRQFVYNGSDGLHVRSMDSLAERQVAGTEDGSLISQTFSPDGQSLAYWVNGELKKVAVSGGAPTRLATTVNSPFGLSWESDGTVLFDQADGVWQVSDNGGEPRRLFETEGRAMQPQRLPGSDWVLYTRWLETEPEIIVQSAVSGEQRVIRTNADSARYLTSGHLAFANDGVLYAVPFDADRLEVTGGPVPVIEGIRRTVGANTLVDFDVSRSGSLVYLAGPAKTSSTLSTVVVADRSGSAVAVGIPPGPYEHVRVSPDGSRLAVGSNDGREANVSVFDVGGKTAMRRLTFGGRNRYPMWSPDGQRVAFQSNREGDEAIFVQRADGTGAVERITKPEPEESHIPEDWSPDGKQISFAILKGNEYSLWIVSPDGGTPTRFGDVRSAEPIGSVFSSDGRWIAYHMIETIGLWQSPDSGVFVEPFPATGARYQAPRVNRDFQPFWSRDDRTLFYVGSTGSRQLVAVPVLGATGITFQTPVAFPFTLTAGRLSGTTRAFDAMPDGRFIGLLPGSGEDELETSSREVRVIVNWAEEVKRLAPTQ